MELSFQALAAIQIAWIIAAILRFLRKSDEIPLLTSAFVFYFGAYRYWNVKAGRAEWVDISNLNFGVVTNEAALAALNAIVLGQSVFLGAYFLFQRQSFPPVRFTFSPGFSRIARSVAFTATLVMLPVSFLVNRYVTQQVDAGVSMAFGISAYLYLFPLVLSSLAIMLVILWRYGGLSPTDRTVALILIAAIFYSTFGMTGRFKFLSWLIASAVILSATYTAARRFWLMGGVLGVALIAFGIAGAQRSEQYGEYGMAEASVDRLKSGEDANMLDGMVFLQQAVPNRLPFRYGGEHLEILIRPIPRALWPDKPVSNYMLKIAGLDKKEGAGGFTIGISPSLFGSFYLEGGYVAIVLLSVVYAYLLARLIAFGASLHPFASLLVRCLVCASLIPLLRGGDLPGVYAWLGMAFWPLILLFIFRRRQLAKNSPWFHDAPPPLPAASGRRLRHGGLAPAPALHRSRF